MKKTQWMLATSLVCGGALFTACSDDSSSSSAPEEPKVSEERAAFVENTRANLKEIAENLNFGSWEFANTLNTNFNQYVLNNPDADNVVSRTFSAKIMEGIEPVKAKSELAKMGYQYVATADLSDFNYRFTMDENFEFTVKKADNFELLLPSWNMKTQKLEKESLKLTLKTGGDKVKLLDKIHSTENDLAVVAEIPTKVSFSIQAKPEKKWETLFSGSFENQFELSGKSEFMDRMTTAFNIVGEVESNLQAVNLDDGTKLPGDVTKVYFAIGQDPSKHKAGSKFEFEHNKKKVMSLYVENSRDSKDKVDLSDMTNSSSLVDVFTAAISGNSVDTMSLVFMDDLAISLKVSDCGKLVKAQQALADARRDYADEKTIENYTKQVNKLVTVSLTATQLKKEIPVQFETVQFGVDFWTMPALQFNKDEGYVPLVEVLDQKSIEYGINIIDHAADPMQEAIVVIRQLLQYFQSLAGLYDDEQADKVAE